MTLRAAFTLTLDGRAATWSPAVREAFGYTAEEFIGRPFGQLFAPAGEVERDRVLERALEDGHAVVAGWRVVRAGQRVLVTGSLSLLVGPDGMPSGIAAALETVPAGPEPAPAEAPAPAELRDLIAEAIWRLPDAFYVLDAEQRFVYMNHVCERLWGRSLDAVRGRHLAEAFPAMSDSEFLLRQVEASRSGEASRFEAFSPVRGRTVEVLVQPLAGGTVALVRDPFEYALAADQDRVGVPYSALDVAVQRYTPADGRLVPVGSHGAVFGLDEGRQVTTFEEKLELVLPVDRGAYELAVSEAVSRREGWRAQYRLRRPADGATAWMAEQATVEAGGETLEYVVMTWDVTSLRRVEEQLRSGTRRLRRELGVNRHLYEVMSTAVESQDVRVGAETLLSAVLGLVGSPRGGLWVGDRDGGPLRVFAQEGFRGAYLSEFGALPREALLRAPASGLAVEPLSPLEEAALAEDGVLSPERVRQVSLPLVGPTGEVLGLMRLHLDDGRRLSERDYYTLKLLAMQVAALLDRQLVEERSGELLRKLEQYARAAGDALLESELMFRRAFELGPVAAVITTRDEDRFLEVNDWYLRLTGYERDEVVGRTARELGMWSSPEDRQKLDAALRAGGTFKELQLRLRTKDGHVRDILLSGEEVTYAGQRCMLKMFNDVTEQRRSQEELMAAIRDVMSDAQWFSQSVVQRLAEMRRVEPTAPVDADLTPREREVLEFVAAGLSDEEVAARLGISQRTARNHLTNTYAKIGAHNRAEAIVWARERGLVARLG